MLRMKNMLRAEDGAITVDWVVLCAALVGLAIAIMIVVSGGTKDLSGEVSGTLSAMDVSTY